MSTSTPAPAPLIRKGDSVTIRPEWQDAGDDKFSWVAVDDEQNGRVTIAPVDTGLTIRPNYVARTAWLIRN